MTEFIRGQRYGSHLYVGVQSIPCLRGQVPSCCSAVFTKRLPPSARFDKWITRAGETARRLSSSTPFLIASLNGLIREGALRCLGSLEQSMEKSDARLRRLLTRRAEEAEGQYARELLCLWRSHFRRRNLLRTALREREASHGCWEVHGDLSAENLFLFRRRLYALDPCVAYKDMYRLDLSCDWAAFCVALWYISGRQATRLTERSVLEACEVDVDLFRHLMERVALIRASASSLAADRPSQPHWRVMLEIVGE